MVLWGVTLERLDFAEPSRIRNEEIGFIFQSFKLIGDLTVYENIELPLTYRPRMATPDRKKRVMETLERVGMAHRFGTIPHNSRAASSKPSILLADEPTGNLDSRDGEAGDGTAAGHPLDMGSSQ